MKTVPFDLDRWKSGELALSFKLNVTAEFVREDETCFHYKLEGETPEKFSLTGRAYKFNKEHFLNNCHLGIWVMKAGENDDGWIYCDGKTVPMELGSAKAGDYEIKWRDGVNFTATFSTREYVFKHKNNAMDVIAVRMIKKTIAEEELENCTTYNAAGYWRFRNSARGKRALAAIGIVDEPIPPIGQCRLEELFAEALSNFEAEIERKRK